MDMYTEKNFKTKKSLKEAVAVGEKIRSYQPNADMLGKDPYDVKDGNHSVEGPHYPEPHKWYAGVTVKDGVIIKVK